VCGDLRAHLRAFLQSRLKPDACLCVGYSGGLDSTALLHALVALRDSAGFSLTAVHVHHGLHAEADRWVEHCQTRCMCWGVPLNIEQVKVERTGHGLEAAAREARLAVFARQAADHVVLGQHLDDQVETGMLRLLRGAGVHGLAGMALQRPAGQGAGQPSILRPLLNWPRAALQAYVETHALDWVEDPGNADPAFSRNWLRHAILPRLETRFPAYRQTLGRAMNHFEEAAMLLDDLAAIDLDRLAPEGFEQGIEITGLSRLSPARRHNLLRYVMRQLGGLPPEQATLSELERQMIEARSHATPVWQAHGLAAVRHRGRLFLRHVLPDPDRKASWIWSGEPELALGDGGRLLFQKVIGAGIAESALPHGPIEFGVRRGGERMRLRADGPERPLKTLLYEAGIPAWQRDRLPLLRLGEIAAWVAGIGVDARFQAKPGEPGWLISWPSCRSSR